ncbi:hypothetical protein RclHR1_06850004 [Rhizophagus clarus]|uniref:U6 snRNA-associated Sm-like protein LSm7 n=1 Tax=Rhizophagus clarus TaxID=94130 RepID=A0A2Z6RTW4_9GLOM|nr:hypothetical protein RclHR1_06850004 [Rhizophagus clarus]GES89052.1 U6 snRNA-associated Sm-like protein LSm7 [Rhizophagus clarus]
MYTETKHSNDSHDKKNGCNKNLKGNTHKNLPKKTIKNNYSVKNYTKKEGILDLNKYLGERIFVKFHGGREVTGLLKGFDALFNLVLDDVVERLKDYEDWHLLNGTRSLGLLICRGTTVILISPVEGMNEISNPFFDDSVQTDDDNNVEEE